MSRDDLMARKNLSVILKGIELLERDGSISAQEGESLRADLTELDSLIGSARDRADVYIKLAGSHFECPDTNDPRTVEAILPSGGRLPVRILVKDGECVYVSKRKLLDRIWIEMFSRGELFRN